MVGMHPLSLSWREAASSGEDMLSLTCLWTPRRKCVLGIRCLKDIRVGKACGRSCTLGTEREEGLFLWSILTWEKGSVLCFDFDRKSEL